MFDFWHICIINANFNTFYVFYACDIVAASRDAAKIIFVVVQ